MTYSVKTDALRVLTVSSGATYTANAYGVISGVPAGIDLRDLLVDGCTFLASNGGLNNTTATTNPAVTDDGTKNYAIGSLWFNSATGVLYMAASVGTGTASWSTIGVSTGNGLPMVTGRFYGIQKGSTQAAVLTVAGSLYATPFYVAKTTTVSTINYSVTTGQTGGLVRGAIYADNGSGYPGAIVAGTDTGDLDGTGTAVVTKSSVATALAPGWYWMVTIATASSTMPSVIGATAIYGNSINSILGNDTAANALATSAKATTGVVKTGQTYPVTSMTVSFPTFPTSAALIQNASCPIAAIGV